MADLGRTGLLSFTCWNTARGTPQQNFILRLLYTKRWSDSTESNVVVTTLQSVWKFPSKLAQQQRCVCAYAFVSVNPQKWFRKKVRHFILKKWLKDCKWYHILWECTISFVLAQLSHFNNCMYLSWPHDLIWGGTDPLVEIWLRFSLKH